MTDLSTPAEDRLRNEAELEEHRDDPFAVDIVTVLNTLAALRGELAESEARAQALVKAGQALLDAECGEHGQRVVGPSTLGAWSDFIDALAAAQPARAEGKEQT